MKLFLLFIFTITTSLPSFSQVSANDAKEFIINKLTKYADFNDEYNTHKIYFIAENLYYKIGYNTYTFPLKYFDRFSLKKNKSGSENVENLDCLCMYSEGLTTKEFNGTDQSMHVGFFIKLNTGLELEPNLQSRLNKAFNDLKTYYGASADKY